MITNNETKTNANVTTDTGTAGISAGANPSIPQHILDFCNRVYPPHLGSAYDGQRAHLVAKRLLIERELVGRAVPACTASAAPPSGNKTAESPTVPERTNELQPSIPSMESILSMLRSQSQPPQPTQPEQTRNDAETPPEQTRNAGGTEPEQPRNNPGTNPAQSPKQNTQTPENAPSDSKSNHNGNESKIDALPSETREFVATLLTTKSLDKAITILTTCNYPGANKLSRSCLYRYRQRILREKAKTRAAEAKQFVEELLANPNAPDDQLAKAISHIFHTRLLETINDPACALEDTLKAIQTCERLRQKS